MGLRPPVNCDEEVINSSQTGRTRAWRELCKILPMPSIDSAPLRWMLPRASFSKNGELVNIQEQPVRLLVVLLKRAGEVVSQEQLLSSIWPRDTFVDFEGQPSRGRPQTARGVGRRCRPSQLYRDDPQTRLPIHRSGGSAHPGELSRAGPIKEVDCVSRKRPWPCVGRSSRFNVVPRPPVPNTTDRFVHANHNRRPE